MVDLKHILINDGYIKETCTLSSEILVEAFCKGVLACDTCEKCEGKIQKELPRLV